MNEAAAPAVEYTEQDEHHEQDIDCVVGHIVGTLNQSHPSR
jgi:hypothetical protein